MAMGEKDSETYIVSEHSGSDNVSVVNDYETILF